MTSRNDLQARLHYIVQGANIPFETKQTLFRWIYLASDEEIDRVCKRLDFQQNDDKVVNQLTKSISGAKSN